MHLNACVYGETMFVAGDWKNFRNVEFYFKNTKGVTFHEAKRLCKNLNATLFTIKDNQTKNFLESSGMITSERFAKYFETSGTYAIYRCYR